jgi:chromosome segregation ATPase
MSTTPQGPYSSFDDLDTTADYPPVPADAPADTWVMSESPSGSSDEDALRAYREEVRTLRQSVATVTTKCDQLQAELTAVAGKRDELQQQLKARDSREADQQRDLSARQEEIGMLRQSLTAATSAHEQLRAELVALDSGARGSGQTQYDTGEQNALLARALGDRDRQIAELTEKMEARAQQHFLIVAERDDLQARLERARADIHSAAQKRERQTTAQADEEREHARRDAALARSLEDLTLLQRRVTGHDEALRRAEARRQVFEMMLREREQLIDEREVRVCELQTELDEQRKDHRAALERANNQLAAAIARAGGGDRPFAEPLPSAPAPELEPPADHAAAAKSAADAKRIAGLEAQIADLHEAVSMLREQLEVAEAADEVLRADLGATESQLRAAETELQQGRARMAELDAQAAASAPPVRTAVRMLVRTEGDRGIVHVLGKRTTIGRIPANDLCIDTGPVSRHHAVVLATDNSTVIEDLNSTNGVFVNNVRVIRHELRNGDLLTIGNTSFRYVLKPEAVQA